jgi:branched-subunit amino acid permease
MKLLFAVFFGAGVAAWIYSKMGRRLGYENSQNVWTVVGVSFVLSAIAFYTVLALFIPS